MSHKERNGPVELTVLSASLRDVFEDVVRVDVKHRPFAKAGRVIVARHNGRRALAVARGPAAVGKSGISMDSALREKLGLQLNQTAHFTFEQAGL